MTLIGPIRLPIAQAFKKRAVVWFVSDDSCGFPRKRVGFCVSEGDLAHFSKACLARQLEGPGTLATSTLFQRTVLQFLNPFYTLSLTSPIKFEGGTMVQELCWRNSRP